MADPEDESDQAARLFRTELTLIGSQIEALRVHAARWLRPEPRRAAVIR